MFFDLLSELINNTSPFYLYVGLLWSMVGALQLINMDMHKFRKNHYLYVKNVNTFQVDTTLIQEPMVGNDAVITWLTHKTKRIETPDDDSDVDSSSISKQIIKIRGGLFWKNKLYSRPLENIAF
ncbi:hypothetical protein KQI49_12155 [Virgibacillus sp. MSJ-26]|uniref:hypothetical protein n=1 Tax=Virgibacillus sp. MSJ-26 TaxID=2841522 RepID=UPI001C11F1A6|nr:hypothetical protein [Virgibacillus sp. MSJ-26]MBU5467572.1 hypothetical protein [Virgibacillus sp. MSJ-26]